MKNISYRFNFLAQFISGLVAFLLNTVIPYFFQQEISWLTVILVTAGVFFSSGFRYCRPGEQS